MVEIQKKWPTFTPELFDSIAPQSVEIRTVAKPLPKPSLNPANILLV